MKSPHIIDYMRAFLLSEFNERKIYMKRIIFVFILLAAFCAVTVSFGKNTVQTTEVRLYYTDTQILKLIPVRTQIQMLDAEGQAEIILKMLIEGQDENLKIKRTIPKIQGGMSVYVKDGIAYVDIKKGMIEKHADGRDIELLTVYSIVNSLASIKGVNNVRFTVCGKKQKNFMGYLDMRETFIPDYTV